MEEESREGERTTDPVCSIVKPEPRTIKVDQCSCLPQPLEASSHDTNITKLKPDLSDLMPRNFASEPRPTNSDFSPKTACKTRWTSSPPSRRDSGSAASGGSSVAGDSAAVCPDRRASSKPTDSPVKRRSKTTRPKKKAVYRLGVLYIVFLIEENYSIFSFYGIDRNTYVRRYSGIFLTAIQKVFFF